MSLASKLPWTHRFAGGFSGIGSQPLPTDADAIDYLTRVAAADGAGVETGVAVAVDAFFRDTKDAGVFDALKACCILAGARTITGALVPLAGPAPTAQGAWASGDYSRTAGMTGDGNALYLDSNYSNAEDDVDDQHMSVYISESASVAGGYIGVAEGSITGATHFGISGVGGTFFIRNKASSSDTTGDADSTGFAGMSRASSSGYVFRSGGVTDEITKASQSSYIADIGVFARQPHTTSQMTDATFAFYSVGTDIGSAGLVDLDTAVTNLITAIGEAL
jgi:hypothetical protein